MPLVEVMVNGRGYQVACDVGEEDRLRELAQQFDKRVQVLASSVGQVGDARLMLMAGLVLIDELSGAAAKSAERDRDVASLEGSARERRGNPGKGRNRHQRAAGTSRRSHRKHCRAGRGSLD